MNYNEFLKDFQNECNCAMRWGLTQEELKVIMNSFITALTKALIDGESVSIPNLGKWCVDEMPAMPHYDIRKQQIVTLPARPKVKFVKSASLIRAVEKQGDSE